MSRQRSNDTTKILKNVKLHFLVFIKTALRLQLRRNKPNTLKANKFPVPLKKVLVSLVSRGGFILLSDVDQSSQAKFFSSFKRQTNQGLLFKVYR